MSTTTPGTGTTDPVGVPLRRRAVAAVAVGNLLEWYDFAVYASVAGLLGRLFFPAVDPLASLLASFSVFAVGYIARPVGAVVFGRLADRRGRRTTLIAVITMMGVATVLIGLMPTYATVGVVAPVLLVLARLTQGLSVGGEFPASSSYLVEIAPPGRRGRYGSVVYVTAGMGFALGIAVVFAMNAVVAPEGMASWGWRVPFLLGFPLLLIGMYLRARATETPAFRAVADNARTARPEGTTPTVGGQWRAMALLAGIGVAFAVSSYTVLAFVLSYLLVVRGTPAGTAYLSVITAIVVGSFLTAIFGELSDRVGRKPLLIAACVGLIVLSVPAYALLGTGGFVAATAGQLLLWLPVAVFCGVVPAAASELFPAAIRVTGVAIPNALVTAIFSGTTPLVATWLIGVSGDPFAPAWYLVGAAVVSLPFVVAMRETARSALRLHE